MDDYGRDFVERDEKRLTELGRRTVEMYVTAAIVTYLQVGCTVAWLWLFSCFDQTQPYRLLPVPHQ